MPPKAEKKEASNVATLQSIYTQPLADKLWNPFLIFPSLDQKLGAIASKDSKQQDLNALLAPLYDIIGTGIRGKFKVIAKADIIAWALENKSYDVSAVIKTAVDQANANPNTEFPPAALAKACKTMLLVLKKEALDANEKFKKASEILDKGEKKGSSAGISKKKGKNDDGAVPESPEAGPKRKAKKERATKQEVKIAMISDEPADGPDVYYVFKDIFSISFFQSLINDCSLAPNLVIRVKDSSLPEADVSNPFLQLYNFTHQVSKKGLWKSIAFKDYACANILTAGIEDGKVVYDDLAKIIYYVIDQRRKYDIFYGNAKIIDISPEVLDTPSPSLEFKEKSEKNGSSTLKDVSSSNQNLQQQSPSLTQKSSKLDKKSFLVHAFSNQEGVQDDFIASKKLTPDLRYYHSLLECLPGESCMTVEIILAALVEQTIRSCKPEKEGSAHDLLNKDIEDVELLTNYFSKVLAKYAPTEFKGSNHALSGALNRTQTEDDILNVIRFGDINAEKSISFADRKIFGNHKSLDLLRSMESSYSSAFFNYKRSHRLPQSGSTFGESTSSIIDLKSTNSGFFNEDTWYSKPPKSMMECECPDSFLKSPYEKNRSSKLNHLRSITTVSPSLLDRALLIFEFEDMFKCSYPYEVDLDDINLQEWCIEEHLDFHTLSQKIENYLYYYNEPYYQDFVDDGIRLLLLTVPQPDDSNVCTKVESFFVKNWLSFGVFVEAMESRPELLSPVLSSNPPDFLYQTSEMIIAGETKTLCAYPPDGSQIRVYKSSISNRPSSEKCSLIFYKNVVSFGKLPGGKGEYFSAFFEDESCFSAIKSGSGFSVVEGVCTQFLPTGSIGQAFFTTKNDQNQDKLEYRIINQDGTVINYMKDGIVKVYYPTGQSSVINGDEVITTYLNGTRTLRRKSNWSVVEYLPYIQQISQRFHETSQTVITRGDLTVVSIFESPVFTITVEHPDGTKISSILDKNIDHLQVYIEKPELLADFLASNTNSVIVECKKSVSASFYQKEGLLKVVVYSAQSPTVFRRKKDERGNVQFEVEKKSGMVVSYDQISTFKVKGPCYPLMNAGAKEREKRFEYLIDYSKTTIRCIYLENDVFAYENGNLEYRGKGNEFDKKAFFASTAGLPSPNEFRMSKQSSTRYLKQQGSELYRQLISQVYPSHISYAGGGPKMFIIKEDGSGLELKREIDLIPFLRDFSVDPQVHVLETPLENGSEGKSITLIKKNFGGTDKEYLNFRQIIHHEELDEDIKQQIFDDIEATYKWQEALNKKSLDNNLEDKEKKNNYFLDDPASGRKTDNNSVMPFSSKESLSAGDAIDLFSISGNAQTVKELLRKYHAVELSIKTQMELKLKMKRKMFTDIRMKQESGDQLQENVSPTKRHGLYNSARHPSAGTTNNLEPRKAFEFSRVWKKFSTLLRNKSKKVGYFESEYGKEFLKQHYGRRSSKGSNLNLRFSNTPHNYFQDIEAISPLAVTRMKSAIEELDWTEDINEKYKDIKAMGINANFKASLSPSKLVKAQEDQRSEVEQIAESELPQNEQKDASSDEEKEDTQPAPVNAIDEAAKEDHALEEKHETPTNENAVISSHRAEHKVDPLKFNVFGQKRFKKVSVPGYMRVGQPGLIPNTKFKRIEEPVKRKSKTASTAKSSVLGGKFVSTLFQLKDTRYGLQVLPMKIDFGILCQGHKYSMPIELVNSGFDVIRFKLKPIPNASLLKIDYKPGLIAAGMKVRINIDIETTLPNPQMVHYIFEDSIQVICESFTLSVPIKATMLRYSAYEEKIKKEKRRLHAANVKLVAQDGQREEIPIDELY